MIRVLCTYPTVNLIRGSIYTVLSKNDKNYKVLGHNGWCWVSRKRFVVVEGEEC